MIRKECPSYPLTIFMAGSLQTAHEVCMDFCEEVGFCVTLNGTGYIYRGVRNAMADQGVVVGLINYPRFPMTPEQLWERAEALAARLCSKMEQDSYTIQAPDKTVFISHREPSA